MMYNARVDAVKEYYKKQGEEIDDTLARPRELEYEQYLIGRIWWCNEQVWPHLCRNWCSDQFLTKRKRGQEARFKSEDVAQNRSGSRSYSETQQYLVYYTRNWCTLLIFNSHILCLPHIFDWVNCVLHRVVGTQVWTRKCHMPEDICRNEVWHEKCGQYWQQWSNLQPKSTETHCKLEQIDFTEHKSYVV